MIVSTRPVSPLLAATTTACQYNRGLHHRIDPDHQPATSLEVFQHHLHRPVPRRDSPDQQ